VIKSGWYKMAANQEPMSETFFTLPLEIQEEILRRTPVPGRQLAGISRASQGLYQASYQPYLEQLCAEPIRFEEFTRYTLTQPLIMGEHHCFTESGVTSLVNCDTRVYIRRNSNSYDEIQNVSEINLNDNTISVQATNDLISSDTFMHNLSSLAHGPDFDLLTEYRIRQQRLGCVKRQPNYAKNYVISKLDTIYKAPIRDLGDDVYVYMYLWINSYAFNIYVPPRNDLFFPPRPTNELLEILNKEIVRLYLAIRHELDKLD
jgi:hypothetical protein